MDKDSVKGNLKQAEGSIQKNAGKLTGNENQQVKGEAKEIEGKIQEGVGKVKDAGRAAADKLR